ncbi:hypothetical protein [Paenibacillus sp. N3.4]|uniref:hypothetical protein n=1 Tax=Paenibacillus sp. N3.4 TaxID=2603222 RepID=UPI0016509A1B|nr:hypothetical protein [Paenibacillus sp. N3.4]
MAYLELNGHQCRYSSDQRPMSTISPHLTERMSGSRRKARDNGQITAVVSACLSKGVTIAVETGGSEFTGSHSYLII